MTTTANDTKRLNYFTGEFLQDEDFTAEQAYHLEMRRRHNRSCHVFGVASGLTVTKLTDRDVQVSDGMAIDKDGNEIVLRVPTAYLVRGGTANVYLTIKYSELKDRDDLRQEGGANDYVRWTERPVLDESADLPPADGAVIVLARIALKADAAHAIDTIDMSVAPRAAASAVAPGSVGEAQIAANSVTAPKLNLAAGSIDGSVLKDTTVAAGKLSLAAGSISGTVLMDNTIAHDKLATDAVQADKIKNGEVTAAKLALASPGTAVTTTDNVNPHTSMVASLSVNLDSPGPAFVFVSLVPAQAGAKFTVSTSTTEFARKQSGTGQTITYTFTLANTGDVPSACTVRIHALAAP
jgi:hypothetical protein